jgi:hypothetical protein
MHNSSISVALAVSMLAASAAIPARAADTESYPAVTSRAVWQADSETLQKARAACLNGAQSKNVNDCFAQQMQKAGASTEAIAFMKRLHNDAYLAKFEDTGRVSIAWIMYPFRANSNTGGLLVNGTPSLVDIDDLSRLPQTKMKSDPAWVTLVARHPQATLWPGDRSGMTGVKVESLPGGGQRFTAEYLVLEGCHACARLARVHYTFEFDDMGRLLGARFLDLRVIQ